MFLIGVVVTGLFLFGPVWSFSYWHAWIYMAVLFIPMFFMAIYLIKHDPELIDRRMHYKEKEMTQKKVVQWSSIVFFIGFLIPGFDFRFGWSFVPVWAVIIADIIIFLGYLLVIWVLTVNSYASRTVQVEKDQKIITTGPYAIVRHPMYVGVNLIFILTPIALGSLWALIPFLFLPVILVPRILNEEEVLKKELKGYKEYMEKVKFRLIPGVW